MKYYTLFIICIICHIQCYTQIKNDFSTSIQSIAIFEKLAGPPLNEKFGNIESIKIVYDIKKNKLYFFDSNKYEYHFEFCVDKLGCANDLNYFNTISYDNKPNQKYLLANINHVKKSSIWFIDIAASDEMSASQVNLLFNKIYNQVFFKEKLKFYLSTPHLINLYEKKLLQIPTIFSNYIFSNSTEQSIEQGEAIGILKKYTAADLKTIIPKENEIIILDHTPEIIPNVKGIIITQFQTPLSHLVILAKNRNIPLYVDINAFSNTKLEQLLHQKVSFLVKNDTYTLTKTSKEILPSVKRTSTQLTKNTTQTKIINLNQAIPLDAQNYIGAKALNMGLLKQAAIAMKNSFKTPEIAYAVPYHYYQNHIQSNEIDTEIKALKNIPTDSIQQIRKQLKSIQKKIKNAPIDTKLVVTLENLLSQNKTFTQFKFRSSTNAEDLEKFNGAGLYDSKSVIIGDSIKTIERGLKAVWASTWNEKAYFERALFGINQEDCAMAVLINRSFSNEIANGVLITKNKYRKKYKGITVNVQKGEESVVEPKEGIICDEFYCHNFNGYAQSLIIDYRTNSSLNNNKPILRTTTIKNLYTVSTQLEKKINELWKKYKSTKIYQPIEIEFKYENNNDSNSLYIKQIRPYAD